MIAQALRAELLKLVKNRWSAFWCYAFAPIFWLVMGLIFETFVRVPSQAAMFDVATPIGTAREGLGAYNNLFLQIFPIAGAAILFAGEYRWETWRAILPRNGRLSIVVAKLIVFALAISLSVLACGLAGLMVGLWDAMQSANVVWPKSGSGAVALSLAIAFAASFLQLMATAGLVMLIAVVGRAMIAAIVGPFIILTVAEIASIRFRLPDAGMEAAAFPNLASNALHQFSKDLLGDPDAYAVQLAAPGAAALILWCVVLTATAIALFQRQDMSKE
jgi:ABC-2 type transport system permease protein